MEEWQQRGLALIKEHGDCTPSTMQYFVEGAREEWAFVTSLKDENSVMGVVTVTAGEVNYSEVRGGPKEIKTALLAYIKTSKDKNIQGWSAEQEAMRTRKNAPDKGSDSRKARQLSRLNRQMEKGLITSEEFAAEIEEINAGN